jgi:Secretion system C-terminal sorting domain
MNYKLLLTTSFITLGFAATAQNAATYAITGDNNGTTGNYNWMNIRKLDIGSGKLVATVFDRQNPAALLTDAETKKTIAGAAVAEFPTATMVAAAAFDKNHNKLFFTPMRKGELRWLDVESNTYYTVTSKLLNPRDLSDEANHITRMDIAADGYGYAVTNDGNHFIQFTTGKKTNINDLGALIDAETNKDISIHNRCSSWGGDMVADAYGKLYIISANHNIFKVDAASRVATYLGAVTGLPANYTTNGAAVDDNGMIVVSSANSYDGLYKFNMKDLAAEKIEGSDKYTASDLANGNLLYQKEADAKRNFGAASLLLVAVANTDARIFPNPVTNNEFKVLFDNLQAGQYSIVLSDLSGRIALNKVVNVYAKSQAETVKITNTLGKGVYFVKLLDTNKQIVFAEKIIIQ